MRRKAVLVFRIEDIVWERERLQAPVAGDGSADSMSLLSRNRSRCWLVIVFIVVNVELRLTGAGSGSGSSGGSELRTTRIVAAAGSAT